MIPIRNAPVEIFLQPGQVFFGDAGVRVRTILGSCVSITLWHPKQHLGGMCHYMLPERGAAGRILDGRYAPEALELLLDQMRLTGAAPREFQAKIFGGGRMFAAEERAAGIDIGARNVDVGRRLLRAQGLHLTGEHLCGQGHRSLIFDIATGDVWVKHMPRLALVQGAA